MMESPLERGKSSMINWVALSVFIFFFLLVTVLGFIAARWRRGDLSLLNEWGLAGRRFGTTVTWFLLGGDLYTAYTFVAVPGLMYATGAQGFFAVPYTVLVYPLIYLLMPKFWSVCKQNNYVTPADFVQGRFGSSTLALVIAITGIVATMPYIALQMFGIEVSIAQMGVNVEVALIIAFLILAAYTYGSGIRASALIALVKDTMIFIVLFAAIIIIPIKLGGFGAIFAAAHHKAVITAAAAKVATAEHKTPPTVFHDILSTSQYLPYTTLALGSALALFLYPHSLTGTLSSNSRTVVKRNAALLPIYSLMLGLLALLGYMAIAAHVSLPNAYGSNAAVPALISQMFPSWFAGFAFAAISIGALVPAAIMSIAAANLFTRNIYRVYFRPHYSDREESNVAKITPCGEVWSAALYSVRSHDLYHQLPAPGRHPDHTDFASSLPRSLQQLVQPWSFDRGLGCRYDLWYLDVYRGELFISVYVQHRWTAIRHLQCSFVPRTQSCAGCYFYTYLPAGRNDLWQG